MHVSVLIINCSWNIKSMPTMVLWHHFHVVSNWFQAQESPDICSHWMPRVKTQWHYIPITQRLKQSVYQEIIHLKFSINYQKVKLHLYCCTFLTIFFFSLVSLDSPSPVSKLWITFTALFCLCVHLHMIPHCVLIFHFVFFIVLILYSVPWKSQVKKNKQESTLTLLSFLLWKSSFKITCADERTLCNGKNWAKV